MVSDFTIAQTDVTLSTLWQLVAGSIHDYLVYSAANAIRGTENSILNLSEFYKIL